MSQSSITLLPKSVDDTVDTVDRGYQIGDFENDPTEPFAMGFVTPNRQKLDRFLQATVGTLMYLTEIYFGDNTVKRNEFITPYPEFRKIMGNYPSDWREQRNHVNSIRHLD